MTAVAPSASIHNADSDVFSIEIIEPYFTVIHIGPRPEDSPALAGRKCSDEEMARLKGSALEIMKQIFSGYGTLYPIDTFGFLILAFGFKMEHDTEIGEMNAIKLLLSSCIQRMWEQLSLRMYISASCISPQGSSVLRAYREARSIAVHFPFLNTSLQLLSGYDIQAAPKPNAAARKELEESWFLASMQGKFSEAKQNIMAIIDYRSSSPRTVITLKDELVARLSYFSYTFCDENNLANNQLIYLLCIIDNLMGANDLKNLKDWVESYYAAVVTLASSGRASDGNSTINQIASYIRKHFDDPDLDAAVLSREFNLNPSYISYAFHHDIGIKLVDFLHMIRINHIKTALTGTNLPIGQIAIENGFYTRAAMTRVFTRYMGINPSEYRRRYTELTL